MCHLAKSEIYYSRFIQVDKRDENAAKNHRKKVSISRYGTRDNTCGHGVRLRNSLQVKQESHFQSCEVQQTSAFQEGGALDNLRPCLMFYQQGRQTLRAPNSDLAKTALFFY